jgi:RNA 2',3'-cyclic 3'-phosphodiesterase
MRVFVGCRLPDDAGVRLQHALQPLRTAVAAERFRWVAPENYHVTLRFFGALPESAVVEACRLLEPVAAGQCGPVHCAVVAPIALPGWWRPGVLALSLDSAGALEHLAQACDAVMAARFAAADQPFRAHLTVARRRRPRRMAPPTIRLAYQFAIASCGIYHSTLLAHGARYDALCELAFGGSSRSDDGTEE